MEKQTLELYRLYKLASQGDAGAQYRLGMRYLNGIGTSQDIRLAYIWLGKAADRNHEHARQDLEHLRTVGIEKLAIAAGISTDINIADSAIPVPSGYVQSELAASTEKESVSEPITQLSPSSWSMTQGSVSVSKEKSVSATPVTAMSVSSARKQVSFSYRSGDRDRDDTGVSSMKKVFWGVAILVAIIVTGWFFKGSFWESGENIEGKPVNSKAVILTDKDQRRIAQKIFDEYYGEGMYKNGCWMIEENACMKFKQVNAVPIKGSSLYNLYVYAYSTIGSGRIDVYTVEVDANTPNEFRVLTSSTGTMAELSDGKKTWKFAKGGRSWSVDSIKEHDGVRDIIRSTYTIVGTDIRSNRVLMKTEPIVVENSDGGQSANPETVQGDQNATESWKADKKSDEFNARDNNGAEQKDNEDRIGQKIRSLNP